MGRCSAAGETRRRLRLPGLKGVLDGSIPDEGCMCGHETTRDRDG
jgi:hypothetical protein